MSPQPRYHGPALLLALSVCAGAVLGCAGLPRIDPTGERVFIWPSHQPVVATAPIVGNPEVPPVFTDYVFPQPAIAPVPTVVPSAPAVAQTLPTVPQDTLSITPQRMLALVGSEVLLKAVFCTSEQYMLTDARVDWMIARQGAGAFVSLGGRGWLRDPLLPWNQPLKLDNQYATGYTATVPLTLSRGTPTPLDDIKIEPGEAWATITSPVEGTTHVTAVAPEIAAWTNRRATATIYWLDVQWTFPSPTITASGSQVLTTTVRRQTDGTPLAGWTVRYQVAEGGAALPNAAADQSVEVTTDANGQASIDVTPTGDSGNTTRIAVQLVRPAGYGSLDSPRLIVANGATTIHWSDGSTPYLPPADPLGAPAAAAPLSNFEPSPPSQTYPSFEPSQSSAPPQTSAGPPILDIEIYEADVDPNVPKMVGGQARFEVVIKNRGESAATDIVLIDRFDEGLGHLSDPNRDLEIKNSVFGDVAAGESRSTFLSFDLLRSGRQCHTVLVESAEGEKADARACIQVQGQPVRSQPSMDVRKAGPPQAAVDEVVRFTVTITNTGDVPLTDLEITDEYAPELRASPLDDQYQPITQGDNRDRFLWRLPQLGVGSAKTFEIDCVGQAPATGACSTVQVTADTGDPSGAISSSAQHCLDIITNPDVVPGSGNAGGGGLQLDIIPLFPAELLAGTRADYQVVVHNKASTSEEQVQLRLIFPRELVPDVDNIESNVALPARSVVNGQLNEVHFDILALLGPDERLVFKIPVNASEAGVRNVVAELSSRNVTQPLRKMQPVTILSN